MFEAVYDLATAPPHEPAGARYSAAEWRVYCQGYGCALAMAGKVMDLAVVRFKLRTKTLQLEARRKRDA